MPHVVFATPAFDQYAVQAFDVNAVDYVLKPFDKSRMPSYSPRAQNDGERRPARPTARAARHAARRRQADSASPAVKVLITTQQRLPCW